mgnify:CR=1 FL=1
MDSEASKKKDVPTVPTVPPVAAPVKKNQVCLVQPKLGGGAKKKGGEELNVDCKDTDKNSIDEIVKTNGGADIKSKYKKALNKKTLEDLRKMAKGKGIKITTKKDGKSVYLKKSSIINKLCNFKHPKKTVKKTTKRK